MKLSILLFYYFIMIMPLMILWMMIFWVNLTPMIMLINLLFFSLFISMNVSIYSHHSFYAFLFFLMMTGGILVIFTFFLSLISNEYSTFNPLLFFIMFTMISFFIYIYKYMKNKSMIFYNNLNNENLEMQYNLFENFSINSIYNFPFNLILMFLMLYLILNLLFNTKICLMNNKPLRSNFN